MPHIFALLIAWAVTPGPLLVPVSVFILWSWFGHVQLRLGKPADFGFLSAPYEKTLDGFRKHLPRVLCPPTVEDDPPKPGFSNRIDWLLTPHAADRDHQMRLVSNPWSWPILDLASRVAVVYPILFASLTWALHLPTELGGDRLFPTDTAAWIRWATIGVIAALTINKILATAMPQGIFEKLEAWLILGAGAGAGAVAILWCARHPVSVAGKRRDFGLFAYIAFLMTGILATLFLLRFIAQDSLLFAVFLFCSRSPMRCSTGCLTAPRSGF